MSSDDGHRPPLQGEALASGYDPLFKSVILSLSKDQLPLASKII